jgi:hypothetical protein|tara:strand:+ start:397 stop:717 length:321 start_codon:yes stop_codon:yes gene_type:complete
MKLKERNMGKFKNKFCNVVDELITLHELGFEEDGHHRWNYSIYMSSCGRFSKGLIASGDYLYLRDQSGDKYTDVSICTLWSRDIAGPIKKREIEDFINMLKQGNVR